jgi:hypothetical protein
MNNESQNPGREAIPGKWKIRIATIGAWVCVALGFLLAVPAVWRMWHEQGDRFSLANYAALGSYLQGAVASLFSLGGLLFIYAAFIAQQRQISQQERELADQKTQLRAQQESIERQNFESSLFQLLNLQNDIVSALAQPPHHLGRQCFFDWFSTFLLNRNSSKADLQTQASVALIYEQFYRFYEAQLGPYFRNLYHIFKFIKSSPVEDKRRYSSLVRAQLSKYELALLFYNCLSAPGQGFKPMVEEYGLFEHLDESLLLRQNHKQFYFDSAYE